MKSSRCVQLAPPFVVLKMPPVTLPDPHRVGLCRVDEDRADAAADVAGAKPLQAPGEMPATEGPAARRAAPTHPVDVRRGVEERVRRDLAVLVDHLLVAEAKRLDAVRVLEGFARGEGGPRRGARVGRAEVSQERDDERRGCARTEDEPAPAPTSTHPRVGVRGSGSRVRPHTASCAAGVTARDSLKSVRCRQDCRREMSLTIRRSTAAPGQP